jgi:hypothetical protein
MPFLWQHTERVSLPSDNMLMDEPDNIELDKLKLLGSTAPGASSSKNPNKAIEADIQLLLNRLEKSPKEGTAVYEIKKSGWVFRKRQNASWKKYWAVLDGDQLSFFSSDDVR